MRVVLALLSGALFGAGLLVSDMVNPGRVLGFLDVAGMADGTWDPTLMFVMGGALVPMFLAWRITGKRPAPVCGGSFPGPAKAAIDGRLVGGAAIFGAGWGLVGFCPGPALTALGTGNVQAMIFVAAMLAGMLGFGLAVPQPKSA